MKELKSHLESIPKSSHFVNVRSHTTQAKWDELRRACYQNAGYQCEICNGRGQKHPVECHEVWDYQQTGTWKGIQKLVRLIALCPLCHETQHIGLATMRGRLDTVLAHYMKVNKITYERAIDLYAEAVSNYHERNSLEWELDMSVLGIKYKPKAKV